MDNIPFPSFNIFNILIGENSAIDYSLKLYSRILFTAAASGSRSGSRIGPALDFPLSRVPFSLSREPSPPSTCCTCSLWSFSMSLKLNLSLSLSLSLKLSLYLFYPLLCRSPLSLNILFLSLNRVLSSFFFFFSFHSQHLSFPRPTSLWDPLQRYINYSFDAIGIWTYLGQDNYIEIRTISKLTWNNFMWNIQ